MLKIFMFFHFESPHMVDFPYQITYEYNVIFKVNPPAKPRFCIPFYTMLICTKFQSWVPTLHSYHHRSWCQHCQNVHIRKCTKVQQSLSIRTMLQAALSKVQLVCHHYLFTLADEMYTGSKSCNFLDNATGNGCAQKKRGYIGCTKRRTSL